MRTFLLAIIYFQSLHINAQNDEILKWINNNAIKIEDANPDTKLSIFNDNIPKKFVDAKLFGFGEASHHGKEFFDLKAKFFKYLVKTQDVKVFIMEDSYPSESGINEWISGGKGDVKTIANNFKQFIWYSKEIVNLLEWMRNYNLGKTKEKQISFYGMDIQNVENINQEIRDFVKKYSIPVSEELLLTADKCADKKIDYSKSTEWANIQIPELNKIENILLNFQKDNDYQSNIDFHSAIRALNYLIKYTYYLQNHTSQVRDSKMYENVKWIVENQSKNGKAFIWAHNEHINNKEMLSYGSGWINLGGHLKARYKNDYYSVGFDFGIGTLPGVLIKKGKPNGWRNHQIHKPISKTYAKILFKATENIYFIDMDKALNSEARKFFNTKNRQLYLGGPGYNPKKQSLLRKKYSEMYDGLIFVKSISVPNYKLDKE